jgi:hypothetical protein
VNEGIDGALPAGRQVRPRFVVRIKIVGQSVQVADGQIRAQPSRVPGTIVVSVTPVPRHLVDHVFPPSEVADT